MGIFWQDVRYALRMIAREPGFAAILVLTIGLGIGATTAVFSVADSILFTGNRPAPALARPVLIWLGAAVAIALLIACVNCANLLIARGMMRRRDLAAGARGMRVFRLMLTESVVLSVLGGAAGMLLACWGADVLIALAPGSISGLKAGVDARVLIFALGLSVLSGVLFGMAPALDSLRSDGQELPSSKIQLLSGANLVVIGEVALAISLMIGASVVLHVPPILSSALLATFAGIILLLAISGVYAVTCQMVGPRSREFSMRLARGASRSEVLRSVAGESMLLVGIGSGVGIVTGIFAARALSSVRAADLTTVVAVWLILAAAAAPASYFPARAASRIEPQRIEP